MLIQQKKDAHGPYYINSNKTLTGHHFYFLSGNKKSQEIAYEKARAQQKSMFANGYKVPKKKK